MKIPALILAAMLTLAGCTNHRLEVPVAKVAIQYASVKFIKNDPVRAQRMANIVREIKKILEDQMVTVDVLRPILKQYIPTDLPPEDQIAILALIDLVVAELNARIADADIPPDVTLALSRVADWILEATEYYPLPTVEKIDAL